MFRKAGKMVVDRWLGLLSRTLLLRKGQKKHAIHTAVVMQSRSSLVTSAHSDCERRSCELAQQASMEANSAAQGALRASFLGRTLSCSNFMMVDESEHVTTLKATKKRCRGKMPRGGRLAARPSSDVAAEVFSTHSDLLRRYHGTWPAHASPSHFSRRKSREHIRL